MSNYKDLKSQSECTTIIVGKNAMADNSRIVARSEDMDAKMAKNFEFFHDTENGSEEFVAMDSTFRCKLPKKAFGYTTVAPYCLQGHWGNVGYNTQGVGMSATETIFSSAKALSFDPYVESGLAENSVYNVVLPYITTAKEGVLRLGKMIEEYGSAEGFGIGFIDQNETWYLENACGHRWLACQIPDDVYFATGNQSRFREYNSNDKKNFLASGDLIDFAKKNNLYDVSKEFDFHTAYSRDEKLDTTYNYPRVWDLQRIFSPEIKNDVTKNTFPVFAKPKKLITITDLRNAFRTHYDKTEHDPYYNNNPKEPYRPISIMRCVQTHILQVRENLPKEIGEVNYMELGMAALSVFIPYYQGISRFLPCFSKGTNKSSKDSAYWTFRKVQTLGMVNYNKYAPMIKERYRNYEAEMDQRMKEMETEYLRIYKEQPLRAKDMIQEFEDMAMQKALDISEELIEELLTHLTLDIEKEYYFHGA